LPKKSWVVIDEVQKIPQLLDVVHALIEKRKIHFALTGSSSRKIKRSGANLLAGRALIHTLFPLNHSVVPPTRHICLREGKITLVGHNVTLNFTLQLELWHDSHIRICYVMILEKQPKMTVKNCSASPSADTTGGQKVMDCLERSRRQDSGAAVNDKNDNVY
jgi:hypothetical protein